MTGLNEYIVADRQTLEDIALMHFGTIEAVIDIINVNPGFTWNTRPQAGSTINLPPIETTPVNNGVRAYFQQHKLVPANNYEAGVIGGGLNTWLWPDGIPILFDNDNYMLY